VASVFTTQFFDGKTAVTRTARVQFLPGKLQIEVEGEDKPRSWRYADLEAVEPPRDDTPLRLRFLPDPAARLIVPVGTPIADLLHLAPHLNKGYSLTRLARFVAIFVLGLLLVAAIGYGVLTIAPQQIAGIMPNEWRHRLGEQTEKAFIKDARHCANPEGMFALTKIARRVASGIEETPEFSVRVYDMPMINAFALPGGKIILTGPLIRQADNAEEIAGILAHELGHVHHRHPEASLVRVIGVQLLLSIATGGGGGDTLGSLAGLVTILRYTRSAEIEADQFAKKTLDRGAIDPLGLRRFFEKLSSKEGSLFDGKIGELTNMLSTHPGTKDRIKQFTPLPEGTARPVLSNQDWRALKKICT
jgi:Zn-dependent protease with chaperone function